MKEIWFIALTWKEMFKENDLIKKKFHMNYFCCAWGKRNIIACKFEVLGKVREELVLFHWYF